jgi:AcrR family transcriptional regulator
MVTKARLKRSAPELRREHILRIAQDAFMEGGFAATSMSAIAARVGGSKATLYKYFSSKEHLFQTIMETTGAVVLNKIGKIDPSRGDVRSFLEAYGSRFLEAIYAQDSLDIHRLVEAEGIHFPEIARIFFEHGHNRVCAQLAECLSQFAHQGMICCPDTLLTAQQFLGMISSDQHMRVLCGLMPAPDRGEIEAQVRHAVEILLFGLRANRKD